MRQRHKDRARFEVLRKTLVDRMERTPELRQLKTHIRFSETPEGLRIDLVDEADFSMFRIGTDRLLPQALALVREVAQVIGTVPNEVIVRGHTDSLPYASGQSMNNWMLSTARAEATRMALAQNGIVAERFARIEGVADREPYTSDDLYDPRNRRMAIILAWSEGDPAPRLPPKRRDPAATPRALGRRPNAS
jgi:chemotaxis protein MotB